MNNVVRILCRILINVSELNVNSILPKNFRSEYTRAFNRNQHYFDLLLVKNQRYYRLQLRVKHTLSDFIQ